MGNNGKGPIPFAVKEGIPIIGQPLTIVTWFPTLSVQCNCDAKQPVLIVGFGNISVCPKCGRGFQLFGATQPDIRKHSTRPHFDINIIMPDGVKAALDEGEEHKPS